MPWASLCTTAHNKPGNKFGAFMGDSHYLQNQPARQYEPFHRVLSPDSGYISSNLAVTRMCPMPYLGCAQFTQIYFAFEAFKLCEQEGDVKMCEEKETLTWQNGCVPNCKETTEKLSDDQNK